MGGDRDDEQESTCIQLLVLGPILFLLGLNTSIPGMFPNMLPFGVCVAGQFNPLAIQPQAMMQQKLVYQVGVLPTKVVCVTQVVSAYELKDDEEYKDVMEDMRLQAGKYGNLVKVVISRSDPSGQPVAGVGKVFLEYADIDSDGVAWKEIWWESSGCCLLSRGQVCQ